MTRRSLTICPVSAVKDWRNCKAARTTKYYKDTPDTDTCCRHAAR